MTDRIDPDPELPREESDPIEDAVDEAEEESFPASDAPASQRFD